MRRRFVPVLFGTSAAAVPWYLSGGVAASACVGSWLAKGAASQAVSYVNLANPGTYDLTAIGAVAWDTTNGWKGDVGKALDTGIVAANNTYTYIGRFSSAPDGGMVLGWTNTLSVWLRPNTSGNRTYQHGGLNTVTSGAITSGVMAVAGPNCYKDGVADGTISQSAITAVSCYLLARNAGGASSTFVNGYVQAAAIYSATLTAPQVLAISMAMAAL